MVLRWFVMYPPRVGQEWRGPENQPGFPRAIGFLSNDWGY
jgi:hypothetical protein